MRKAFLEKRDIILWMVSLAVVIVANVFSPSFDRIQLLAAIVGVSSLIFAAKGYVVAQVLMIAFSILYGIISFRFSYFGEMITYLGMTMPMAIWATITWFLNRSDSVHKEVKIRKLNLKQWLVLSFFSVIVTIIFYFVLKHFKTPNLFCSTMSITTSFFGASLTILRSSYFGLAYALNDLVLIVLWILATIKDVSFAPMIVIFVIFFVNDIYGFVNWVIREKTMLYK